MFIFYAAPILCGSIPMRTYVPFYSNAYSMCLAQIYNVSVYLPSLLGHIQYVAKRSVLCSQNKP